MIAVLHEAAEHFQKSDKPLRSLSNMSEAFMGIDYMNELKRLTPIAFAPKAHKAAIIGVNDLKAIIMKGYNSGNRGDIVTFKTKQEALEFLVS